MSRSTLFLILLLVIVVGGIWYLSTVDTDVPLETIEVPVAENALES